jgi:hypothetical protein
MIVRTIPAGDLALGETGDFVWLQPGPDYTRQRLAARIKFFLGEWFLDSRKGVPYLKHVLVKNPDLNVVRQVFRRTILGTPGVLGIVEDKIDLAYDPTARSCAVGFSAIVEGGVIKVALNDPDFLIAL